MPELRTAIIGLAHLHPLDYLRLIEQIDEIRLVAVAEPNTALLSQFTRLAHCAGYRNYEELLERDDIQCVLIFLPHSDCPEAAIRAAQAEKHVVVEKPCAATPEGVKLIAAGATAAGVKFTTPFCWRYSAAAQAIRDLIMEGALGRITALEGRCAAGKPDRYRQGNAGWMLEKAKSGGGPMYNLGVHWIDLFRWLLAEEVIRVTGMIAHNVPDMDVEDTAFGLLTFRSGAIASLDISYSVPASYPQGRDLFIGIRGTEGVITWKPGWQNVSDEVFLCTEAPGYASTPIRRLTFETKPVEGYSGIMGLQFLREFAECVLEDRYPPITGEDAIRAAEVAAAVYESAESGQAIELRH